MCGIVGYIGKNNIKDILLGGLSELEYRGYDSSGIAVLQDEGFSLYKAIGKLENLRNKIKDFHPKGFSIGIGHTRWATHGKPTELNAHPHVGENSYVVHNGIIENYQELKLRLQDEGFTFLSQTDTEVIVLLFESNLLILKDPLKAFRATLDELQGAYTFLLITKSAPDTIFFAKHGSPMLIGLGSDEKLFASSDTPLIGLCKDVIYLNDGDNGFLTPNSVELFDKEYENVIPILKLLPSSKLSAQKDGYRFFMEKEIYEQSQVVSNTLMGRLDNNQINFDELDPELFSGINEIKLCACGTSYHSALAASYLFERYSKIRCSVEISSEFRYKEPLLCKDTLFVVISQSGETADTLETLKMAKRAGLKSLVICNVDNSSMVREADATILTRAGIEKGVASTKAFTTQIVVFWMLSLYIAKLKATMSSTQISEHILFLREVPDTLVVKNDLHEKIRRLSKRYLHGHGFFFIGRDIFFPLALEGALKLKEISYLHAEGYPSGEMKHGPIALADPELFTIALMPQNLLYEKNKSNVEELSARDSTICAISAIAFDKSDDFIKIETRKHYMHEFFEMLIVIQLLSLEISVRLGNDVDMPKNLAKSVTVE